MAAAMTGVMVGAMPQAMAQPMPVAPPQSQQITVQVPQFASGGHMIVVNVNGAPMQVQVPEGLTEGQSFVVNTPPPMPVAAGVVQQAP